MKELIIGESFFDYSTNKDVVCTYENKNNYIRCVVKVINGKFKYGFYEINPCENIRVHCIRIGMKPLIITASSKKIFPSETLAWDNIHGIYVYTDDIYLYTSLISRSKHIRNKHLFNYSILREYEADKNMKKFMSNKVNFPLKFDKSLKTLIPYTFGIEYETSEGMIPEDECFKKGLIPLRDGSITGNEYATIVMDSTDGFERIKAQSELLKEYTDFDKDCSLHIHFGGFPINPDYLIIIYGLLFKIQNELATYLPVYSFTTSLYKNNGKDYCQKFSNIFYEFKELYFWLSGGYKYFGSLSQPHPCDDNGEAKWNIKTRYYFVNMINTCFYKRNKTIEFRILRPTTNYNKIINWIYIFSAILKYAENIYEKEIITVRYMQDFIQNKSVNIGLILDTIYSQNISDYLKKFLTDCMIICNNQNSIGDYIGSKTEYEDNVLISNVLESCGNNISVNGMM